MIKRKIIPGFRVDPHRRRVIPDEVKQKQYLVSAMQEIREGKVRVVVEQQNNQCFEDVRQMVEASTYTGYSGETVVMGYNVSGPFSEFKLKFPGKIICYQLEQLYNNQSNWFNMLAKDGFLLHNTKHTTQWLKGCDEIWDYDLDNISFLNRLGYQNIKFRPMQYFEGIRKIEHAKKDIDILFFGSMNEKRGKFIRQLSKYKLKLVTPQTPAYGKQLDDLIGRAKIILNLHFYESHLQEQVRLFPLVANDCCILSEKSRYNYFGDLIHEFEGDGMLPKIDHLLNDNYHSEGIGEKFRNRNFKVGAAYNTFYGLDIIQKSIDSISAIVDYIVIVHQRKSFSNEPESPETRILIEQLRQKYDVVFYENDGITPQSGVLEKRNIGVDCCRKAGCDYIIPLDTDELYDCAALMKDIYYMHDNGIETLYSHIRTYYYDEKHYFDDSYFVPTVYRINDRKFDWTKNSVLCDPARQMPEGKYIVSKNPMKHYCYLKEFYGRKIKNHVMAGGFIDQFTAVYNYMITWQEGMPALAFTNEGESVVLAKIPLQIAK